ncbi:MAG: hypothetical protein Q8K24_09430 [Hydrogenophaga sp.]|nr:hypothetical protein [Hydrogenophaga sp.]
MNVYNHRAAAQRATHATPAHAAALRRLEAHRAQHRAGPRRLSAALRDWGATGTPPPAWRAVDASARTQGVAVCFLADFDAVSLSAGPALHAYAGTPSQALTSIGALVALREGSK